MEKDFEFIDADYAYQKTVSNIQLKKDLIEINQKILETINKGEFGFDDWCCNDNFHLEQVARYLNTKGYNAGIINGYLVVSWCKDKDKDENKDEENIGPEYWCEDKTSFFEKHVSEYSKQKKKENIKSRPKK
jgi:hypothetical protein